MVRNPMSDDPLTPDLVVLDLAARTRSEVLDRLSEHAGAALGRDAPDIARALAERERLGSTGVGSGVALPHADLPDLDQPFSLFARLVRPVEWDAIDERPIDLVMVVLSRLQSDPGSPPRLARFARILRRPEARRGLAGCRTVEGVLEIFATDGRRPGGQFIG